MYDMSNWLNNIQLEGGLVKLIPLTSDHRTELLQAAADGELWNLWYTSVPSKNTINDYIDHALAENQAGRAHAFVIINKSTNKIIGSTRYCNAINNNRVEIGYTWYAKSTQRTGINTECKLLLLQHAFEVLNCIAVEFRTNWHNIPSRNAITRLGAKQDGVLRNHLLDTDGAYRDTVVFSITKEEWPTVKKSLAFKNSKIY
jgi:RimJ/RimL family protein N-acetyltransferase